MNAVVNIKLLEERNISNISYINIDKKEEQDI